MDDDEVASQFHAHTRATGNSTAGAQAAMLRSGPSSWAAGSPQTPVFVSALSAAVVPTLESAQIYEPIGGPMGVSRNGELLPTQSKKRMFPPALRRLRDRLHTLETRLQLEVNALKQEINDLNTQTALLETRRYARRTRLTEVTSRAVRTYFEVFRDGISTTNTHDRPQGMDHQLQDNRLEDKPIFPYSDETPLDISTLRRYLDTVAHPEMQFGPFVNGQSELITQWRRYSEGFDSLNCTLSSFSSHGSPDEPIVVAVATLSGYVTQRMIEAVYPHVLGDGEIVAQLVGSCIKYPVRKVFYFNDSGQLIRLDWDVDFVAALQVVLDSLAFANRLLDGAKILESGYIDS